MSIKTKQRLKYIVSDLVATEVAVLLFDIYRYYALESVSHAALSIGKYLSYPMIIASQIVIPLMMMGIYYLSGYYNKVFVKSRIGEFITTFKSVLFGSFIVFFAQLINDLSTDRWHDYMLFFMLFGLMFLLVYLPRAVITARTLRIVRDERLYFPSIIVGREAVKNLRHRLVAIQHTMGLKAVAYVDASGSGVFAIDSLPGVKMENLEAAVRDMNVENIVILQPAEGMEPLLPMIHRLLPMDVAIYVMPCDKDLLISRRGQSSVTGEPLVEVSCTRMPESTLNVKRVSDVIVSLLALAVLALPMGVIAAFVKLDSPGSVIYRQRRVGFRRKSFDILKFRTMRTDAEASGTPRLSMANDSRITKVGRVLRKYRLDELPQFFNVLRGDMSVVGPRPEREYFIRQIVERDPMYTLLHQVRPGITSWGMVKYGYATSVDQMVERMRYDLLYIDNISFAVDMRIILHTAVTVVSGKGL